MSKKTQPKNSFAALASDDDEPSAEPLALADTGGVSRGPQDGAKTKKDKPKPQPQWRTRLQRPLERLLGVKGAQRKDSFMLRILLQTLSFSYARQRAESTADIRARPITSLDADPTGNEPWRKVYGTIDGWNTNQDLTQDIIDKWRRLQWYALLMAPVVRRMAWEHFKDPSNLGIKVLSNNFLPSGYLDREYETSPPSLEAQKRGLAPRFFAKAEKKKGTGQVPVPVTLAFGACRWEKTLGSLIAQRDTRRTVRDCLDAVYANLPLDYVFEDAWDILKDERLAWTTQLLDPEEADKAIETFSDKVCRAFELVLKAMTEQDNMDKLREWFGGRTQKAGVSVLSDAARELYTLGGEEELAPRPGTRSRDAARHTQPGRAPRPASEPAYGNARVAGGTRNGWGNVRALGTLGVGASPDTGSGNGETGAKAEDQLLAPDGNIGNMVAAAGGAVPNTARLLSRLRGTTDVAPAFSFDNVPPLLRAVLRMTLPENRAAYLDVLQKTGATTLGVPIDPEVLPTRINMLAYWSFCWSIYELVIDMEAVLHRLMWSSRVDEWVRQAEEDHRATQSQFAHLRGVNAEPLFSEADKSVMIQYAPNGLVALETFLAVFEFEALRSTMIRGKAPVDRTDDRVAISGHDQPEAPAPTLPRIEGSDTYINSLVDTAFAAAYGPYAGDLATNGAAIAYGLAVFLSSGHNLKVFKTAQELVLRVRNAIQKHGGAIVGNATTGVTVFGQAVPQIGLWFANDSEGVDRTQRFDAMTRKLEKLLNQANIVPGQINFRKDYAEGMPQESKVSQLAERVASRMARSPKTYLFYARVRETMLQDSRRGSSIMEDGRTIKDALVPYTQAGLFEGLVDGSELDAERRALYRAMMNLPTPATETMWGDFLERARQVFVNHMPAGYLDRNWRLAEPAYDDLRQPFLDAERHASASDFAVALMAALSAFWPGLEGPTADTRLDRRLARETKQPSPTRPQRPKARAIAPHLHQSTEHYVRIYGLSIERYMLSPYMARLAQSLVRWARGQTARQGSAHPDTARLFMLAAQCMYMGAYLPRPLDSDREHDLVGALVENIVPLAALGQSAPEGSMEHAVFAFFGHVLATGKSHLLQQADEALAQELTSPFSGAHEDLMYRRAERLRRILRYYRRFDDLLDDALTRFQSSSASAALDIVLHDMYDYGMHAVQHGEVAPPIEQLRTSAPLAELGRLRGVVFDPSALKADLDDAKVLEMAQSNTPEDVERWAADAMRGLRHAAIGVGPKEPPLGPKARFALLMAELARQEEQRKEEAREAQALREQREMEKRRFPMFQGT